jgi:hypothetical protein
MSNRPALRDQRLRIMEGVLSWEGEIGNARVRQLFDLQPVQASRLLADFRAMLGEKLTEDGRAKVLRLANPGDFECSVPLNEYVLHTMASEVGNPALVDARVDLTEVRPEIFATLRKAVLTKTGVEIAYASMTNPAYGKRVIFPRAIVHVGRRWHVRAWCMKRQDYRDFTMGRIRSAESVLELFPLSIEKDDGWETFVELELQAHRELSPDQQQVVRNEFFSGKKSRFLSIRACLAQYVIYDLKASIDPVHEKPPEFQLEVSNSEKLLSLLFD